MGSQIPQDIEQIMQEVDADGSGCIDYTEFLAAALDKRIYAKQDVCWSAFCVFDKNNDGKITLQELKQVLGNKSLQGVVNEKDVQDIEKVFKDTDSDGDKHISFDEFLHMMHGSDRKTLQGGRVQKHQSL